MPDRASDIDVFFNGVLGNLSAELLYVNQAIRYPIVKCKVFILHAVIVCRISTCLSYFTCLSYLYLFDFSVLAMIILFASFHFRVHMPPRRRFRSCLPVSKPVASSKFGLITATR